MSIKQYIYELVRGLYRTCSNVYGMCGFLMWYEEAVT